MTRHGHEVRGAPGFDEHDVVTLDEVAGQARQNGRHDDVVELVPELPLRPEDEAPHRRAHPVGPDDEVDVLGVGAGGGGGIAEQDPHGDVDERALVDRERPGREADLHRVGQRRPQRALQVAAHEGEAHPVVGQRGVHAGHGPAPTVDPGDDAVGREPGVQDPVHPEPRRGVEPGRCEPDEVAAGAAGRCTLTDQDLPARAVQRQCRREASDTGPDHERSRSGRAGARGGVHRTSIDVTTSTNHAKGTNRRTRRSQTPAGSHRTQRRQSHWAQSSARW